MWIYERHGPDLYKYLHTSGSMPICVVRRVGDGWDLMFERGPRHRGPYHYARFETAHKHLRRYLSIHADRLVGPLSDRAKILPTCCNALPPPTGDAMGRPYPEIVVDKRRQRRSKW
ncbi:MAG: hypothetical protein GAK28_00108 [Luteibacter sp.]|nr:MAG: hypothetical protein GAK28_00108 [Luteibacter sp.]